MTLGGWPPGLTGCGQCTPRAGPQLLPSTLRSRRWPPLGGHQGATAAEAVAATSVGEAATERRFQQSGFCRCWSRCCWRRSCRRPYPLCFGPALIWPLFLPLEFCRQSPEVPGSLQLGKLAARGRLNAVAPGPLVHVVDQNSKRHFLVDTGASFSIFPHQSSAAPSGPTLFGPAGKLIPCWGQKTLVLSFNGRRFEWIFLLAAFSFPIIGVDFFRHYRLLIDPAANRLVDPTNCEAITTVSGPADPATGSVSSKLPSTPQSPASPPQSPASSPQSPASSLQPPASPPQPPASPPQSPASAVLPMLPPLPPSYGGGECFRDGLGGFSSGIEPFQGATKTFWGR